MKSGLLILWMLLNYSSYVYSQQSYGYLKRYPPATYKAGPFVYHLVIDQQNIIYFATNQGLVEYDGERWRIIDGSKYADVRYVALAPDSTLYFAANNDFGYIDTDSTGNLLYQSLAGRLNKKKTELGEMWQVQFVNDNVYFQSYDGIFKWDNNKIEIIHLKESYIFNIDDRIFGSSLTTLKFGPIEGDSIIPVKNYKIIDDIVYQVFRSGPEKYMIATSENGLYWYNTRLNEISKFECEADRYIIENFFFDGIRLDDNNLVFGTWEGGVILINREGEIRKKIDKSSGLLADMVYHMAVGNDDNLWLATSDGIAKLDVDSLGIFFKNSFDTDEDQVIIREVVVNEEEDVYHNWYQKPSDYATSLSFAFSPDVLAFYYSCPDFAGENAEYAVLLEGFEDTWSSWSGEFKKEYTRLKEGEYTFRVRARDSVGRTAKEATLHFVINTPWYESPVRYIFALLLIGAIAIGFVKYRTNRLKKLNVYLETSIENRTKDLIQQQKRLKKINTELLNSNNELDSFVYHTSHDLKAPLKSILGLISLSQNETDNNKNLELYLEMMEKSIHKLEEFISSVIEYSLNVKADIDHNEINFEEIIDESLEQLKEYRNLKEIEIQRNIKINKPFYSDPKRLKIIFNNLITNAVKYHDFTKKHLFVKIIIIQENNHVNIRVEDNGKGIDPKFHEKIFEMFFRASEKSTGSGLGLYIVKQTISKLNGTILLKSEYGTGTTFIIDLPNLS